MSANARVRCDTSGWSELSLTHLDDGTRQKILTRQAAVRDYFHYVPLRAIASQYGLVPSEVLRLAQRCTRADELGDCYEWRGILLRAVLRPYRRRSPINDGHAQRGRGLSCAFGDLLLRKPEIAAGLRKELDRSGGRNDVHEFKYSLKSLFRHFRTLCAKAGVRHDEYPLMTKLQGYRSLGEFARRELQRNFEHAVKVRYGEVAASHMKVGTGHVSRRTTARPFDALQMDGFDLPMIGCVLVPSRKGVREVAADRLWLCPVVDVELKAVLGYSASVGPALTDGDALDAVENVLTPWEPRDVSASGLTYPVYAGFPSGLSPLFAQCGCSTLFIDNAEIHLGKAVQDRIARRLGCSINLGPVRRWDRRALIERIGGMLKREGFARVPSSMGSGPNDPHRNDPVGMACRKRILIDHLFDLVDVEIATLNGLETEGLYNITPLQYARQFLEDPTILWPVLPPLPKGIADLDTDVKHLPVAGSASGGRRPYVQIDRVTYTNDVIAASPELYGTEVWVHIRRSDLRTVKVFADNGLSLGTARAMGGWDQTAHSLKTRRLYNSLKDNRLLKVTADTDPVIQLVGHLSDEVRRDADRAKPKVSAAASALARVMRESGLPAAGPSVHPTHRPLTLREELARKRGIRHD